MCGRDRRCNLVRSNKVRHGSFNLVTKDSFLSVWFCLNQTEPAVQLEIPDDGRVKAAANNEGLLASDAVLAQPHVIDDVGSLKVRHLRVRGLPVGVEKVEGLQRPGPHPDAN